MSQPRVFLTTRDDCRRMSGGRTGYFPHVSPKFQPPRSVDVEERVTYQEIEGFGGAFTEAAAFTLTKLPEAKQEEVIRAYFDPEIGNAYTLCRTHINSCDFSLGNYACCEKDGDFALETFSIDRERKHLLPMIKRALRVSRGGFRLLASPWSPPAWMKTNGSMNRGGTLKPDCHQVWADYYVRFIQEYQKEGVALWGLTVQNEPGSAQEWDSCLFSSEEEGAFVRDYLGPTLERAGLGDRKIIVWDHNREKIFQSVRPIFDDPEASQYIWGAGFHWYAGNNFESIQRVHDAWPDKKLLFTEGCQEGGPHHGSWLAAERYGESIIQDLNHWAAGWVDWNMVLDEKGGPNHVGNHCHAPILIDTERQEILVQPSYYYLGHFSRFIKPGARRVLCASGHDELEATACVNPDGQMVVVVMNRSEFALNFDLKTSRGYFPMFAPVRSLQTILLD